MAEKALIICYYWPPAGGPGVQRWLKFVKYLPEFGIEPVVFIPENPSYPLVDETLVNEVTQGITIIKHPITEPYGWASKLSRKQTKSISSGIIPKERKQSFLQKAMLYIRGNFFVPDARILWVKPSVRFLRKYISDNSIETIITTGPPHSLHLIGLGLKKEFPEMQWITDFRDPWTTIGYHDKLKMTTNTKAKHKRLEQEVLQMADKVIVTSPSTAREFEAITQKPIHVITNGFDDEGIPEVPVDDTFTISHVGSLLSDRNPKSLWKAIAQLKEEYSAFAKALKIKLAGKVSQEVIDSIATQGLAENLEVLGYVSHKEALILQRQASILLLIEIDATITKGIIAGKLFEYLASRRPILAVGPAEGDVEAIIDQTGAGKYFTYNSKEEIKHFVLEKFKGFISSKDLSVKSVEINKYHRRELTSRLAEIIKI
ncbi:glycosyl transferase family 1 [Dokdonia sinensis]|uniref:Glycosyl transferase family 1 n=1 Tax=Dokdonia sinensis TaxID=2479847 RepID=A0A3M0G065_9FLAO|nr:glycosyltransferase family 4 protein [Dokdonia sinensis]RMB57567.1 glycosyl transferase family 1 [Dokdonia sinensis]